MIDAAKLCKTYQQGATKVHALKNISFSLNAGESLAVTGPSGSGKTTLLSILAGLETPSSGTLAMAGENILLKSEKEKTSFRVKNIGIVFQQFHLLPHLTALENVSLPLEIAGEKDFIPQAQKMLEQVGLGHRLHHFPSQMSGGEQQRTAIARACIAHPRVLLADEPTGNLDQQSGRQAMDILFSLVKNSALVLVTHNMELAQRCSRMQSLTGSI